MKLNYVSALEKHGLKEEELSVKIRGAIKRLKSTMEAIDLEKANLPNIKSERAAQAAKNRIEQAEFVVKESDDELVGMIDKFVANREVNKKRAENLAKHRQAKQANNNPPAAPPVNEPNNPPAAPPVNEPNNPPAAPPANPSKKKVEEEPKKKSGVGWLVGALAVGVLAAIGINIYNNRN
jgi:hypothetical protein